MHVIESLGLQVEKPMTWEIDNSSTIGLANNWCVGGRTRRQNFFLYDMKEAGVIEINWIQGWNNEIDMCTKNLPRLTFNTCIIPFVGSDKYIKHKEKKEEDIWVSSRG